MFLISIGHSVKMCSHCEYERIMKMIDEKKPEKEVIEEETDEIIDEDIDEDEDEDVIEE